MEKKLQRWITALSDERSLFYGMVLDNETELLDANTSQLEQGKDSLGNFLQEYFEDGYAEYKQYLNNKPPFGVPDLKLEGDFHRGFVLKWQGDEFQITSTDSKTDKLIKKYGLDIFGIATESMERLKPLLIETFQNELLRKTKI